MENITTGDFFDKVIKLLENARQQVKMALNISMVYSYYEVGRMIIEEDRERDAVGAEEV